MAEEMILEVSRVSKTVGGRRLADNVTFAVKRGEICGFVGPNGAGKTTLIRMMTGLIRHSAGAVRIGGIDVRQDRRGALAQVGAIVESPIFFPYMTGRENLLNLARLHEGLPKTDRAARVDELLTLVGLNGRGGDKVRTYSLGMNQRLGIAQALLGQPSLIILDEPANGLDPMGIRDLRNLILKLREELGLTFFVSSHLLDELQRICDRFVILREGRLVWQGTKEEWLKLAGAEWLEEHFVRMMSS